MRDRCDPPIRPVAARFCQCQVSVMQTSAREFVMPETTTALAALSDSTAQHVKQTARSVVAVHSGGRWPASGIHWRSGIVVTAEEVLERDENIRLTLPGGRLVAASLPR